MGKKKIIALVIAAVVLISGIVFALVSGSNLAVSDAEIFTKTMADFGEDRFITVVESATNDGRENFIVYQEGVFSIAPDKVLERREDGTYVVEAEEEALKFAQKDALFFIEGSSEYPEAVVAKARLWWIMLQPREI